MTDTVASDTAVETTPTPATAVQLVGLRKEFGPVVAVASVDLTIADGEFFALLGPSGSGKTTVLRMIAGFEQPTAGAVLLGGRDVTHVAPYDRNVNTVFQDYALFPHMTVQENVEYGLRVTKVARAERRRRAGEMLETVRLAGYGGRKPDQLSGGQRQRIALARALVNRPKVLLLDEPLGALDLKLREEMQVELKAIQHEVGITFVFVTHDQGEALSMSDRIAVFNHGRIEQVGAPREVYERPTTPFVAGFVGTSNLLTGALADRLVGREGTFTVRPERIRVAVLDGGPAPAVGDDQAVAEGTVRDVQYLGSECRVRVALDGDTEMIASVPSDGLAGLDVGARACLVWPRAAAFHVAQPPGADTSVPANDTELGSDRGGEQ